MAKKIRKNKPGIEIGLSSIIGTRSIQEDTIFGCGRGERALAVVCDGMGGLADGELASKAAADSLTGAWLESGMISDVPRFLKEEAVKADEKVRLLQAGTTIASVIIQGNQLYWLSIGDSKIYIIRGNEMLAVSREHNYRLVMDEKIQRGEMTPEEYSAEEYRAGALISYLGMGNVALMDINRQPFLLQEGDIVLLGSDGIHRNLENQEMLDIIQTNKKDMQHAADVLLEAVESKGKTSQDNASVVIVRYG